MADRSWMSAALLLAPLYGSADAADITKIRSPDGLDVIVISGELKTGDDKKFVTAALTSDEAMVMLESHGGTLVPALEIGRAIHLKGFSTLVPADAYCESACALIWLAGSVRLKAAAGHIGFHAAYVDEAGKATTTSVGNALVGRYVTQLDLSERAVEFVVDAPPQEIEYLTDAKGARAGISFKTVYPSATSPASFPPEPARIASPAPPLQAAPRPEAAPLPVPPPPQPVEAHAANSDVAAIVRRMAVPVFAGDIPGVKYRIVGSVSTNVNRGTAFDRTTLATLHSKLWDKARRLGADAVVHAKVGKQRMGALVWSTTPVSGDAVKFDQ